MLEVSDSACKELKAFFAQNPSSAPKIRIYSAMGCGGPMLNIALDEPTDKDFIKDLGDFSFCIDKSLLDQVKSVKVDLSYMGFIVTPEVPLPVPEGFVGGCQGCTSCH